MKELRFNLQLFAGNANTNVATVTSEQGVDSLNPNVSVTMKTFYKTSLLENARNEHYFNQFGQKQPLPKNNGKKVEWRKFETYDKATTPLVEGVTPDGNTVKMTKIEQEIKQYGDYTTISDRLELEAVDPIIVAVTEEHGAQAGDTVDTITRNELMTGANVMFPNKRADREHLVTGDLITPTLIDQAVTFLKKNHAPTINGDYIAIIHPSVAYDLRESTAWLDVHKYAQPGEIYNGEIGKLHGVRFIENTEAKVWKSGDSANAVYATTIFGKDAYGIIEPSAESMEVIVKQRGSAGTSDPLDQRSTVGWKCSHAAKILYEERLVRLETLSYFSDVDKAN